MASGASSSQKIKTSGGWISLGQLYKKYVNGELPNYRIAYMDPVKFNEIKYMTAKTMFDAGLRLGVRLTTEDDTEVIVSAEGAILDMAEDYPPRPVARQPADAKCLVGPDLNTSTKYLVRKIKKREFVIINCITVAVPNMIAPGGFVIIS